MNRDELARIDATEKEKSAMFEWLRAIALDNSGMERNAAIALQELTDYATLRRASALSAQQPVAWMLRGDVEQQTTVFFSYGQATYALEARTKSGWNQHIVPLYTSRQPAQSNVPVFGPNGNVSIMFSATKEQEEEHQRVIEASKAAFGLSTPAPQQGQTDAFSTLQAIRPFFADRLADGIDSTGERQTYELMLGIIDRASPPPAQQGPTQPAT